MSQELTGNFSVEVTRIIKETIMRNSERRGKYLSVEVARTIQEAILAGLSYREIMRRYGVSPRTISNCAKLPLYKNPVPVS